MLNVYGIAVMHEPLLLACDLLIHFNEPEKYLTELQNWGVFAETLPKLLDLEKRMFPEYHIFFTSTVARVD